MIGVGDHCDPDVAASARTASGTSGKISSTANGSVGCALAVAGLPMIIFSQVCAVADTGSQDPGGA